MSPPSNTRRPTAGGPRSARVVEAPADVILGDDSPLPGPATTTVRPPGRTLSLRSRRALRTLQFAAGVMVVLAASIGVGWGARRYVTSSPRFGVRTVLVDGAHRRSAALVTSEAGVAVGQNIFTIDPARAGSMVTQDPWIERAMVTRQLPSTVSITVVEREATALAALGGELYLATRDGDLFKKLGEGDPSDLPIITGIPAAQVVSDRPGVVLAVKRVLDVADELGRVGVTRRYPLQELHLEKDGSLVATVGREAIALSLGQPPYRDKIEEAARILTEVARRKANASVIFLDNDAHPERVVVRMR